MKAFIDELIKNKKLTYIFSISIILTATRVFFLPKDQNILVLFPLYITTAMVFLWYSYDNYTSTAQYSNVANMFLKKLKIKKKEKNLDFSILSKVQSVLEFLCALSFLTGYLLTPFSLIASIIVLAVIIAYEESFGNLLIRDIGIFGATLSIFLINISF